MLHTKPRSHWPFGSGEDFWRFFTIYGHGGHLGHVTQTPHTIFHSPNPWRLHMNLAVIGQVVLEKKIFENGGRTDDGRTDDGPWLYYKLTNEPKASGEQKKNNIFFVSWRNSLRQNLKISEKQLISQRNLRVSQRKHKHGSLTAKY